MYPRILERMRRLVLEGEYVMTLDAVDELEADRLTVYDVESVVLTGEIVERQTDRETSERKYRLRGRTLAGGPAEVVAKVSTAGKLVLVTVYEL